MRECSGREATARCLGINRVVWSVEEAAAWADTCTGLSGSLTVGLAGSRTMPTCLSSTCQPPPVAAPL